MTGGPLRNQRLFFCAFFGKIAVSQKKIGKKVVPLLTLAGLRPGEKLYEEKLMAEEGIKKTDNELIYIGKPIPFEIEQFLEQLEELANASYENSEDIVELVEKIVPSFHPTGEKPDGKNHDD